MTSETLEPGLVETYSGFRLHERPRRFRWKGTWLTVHQVLEQGATPQHRYFKVATAANRVFLLRYHHLTDTWEVRPWGRAG